MPSPNVCLTYEAAGSPDDRLQKPHPHPGPKPMAMHDLLLSVGGRDKIYTRTAC